MPKRKNIRSHTANLRIISVSFIIQYFHPKRSNSGPINELELLIIVIKVIIMATITMEINIIRVEDADVYECKQ